MDERRGWAEALVMLGGGTLVVTFFLPVIPKWGPTAEGTLSTAGMILEMIREPEVIGDFPSLLRVVFGTCFILAPPVFGAFVLWEAAANRLGAVRRERLFRAEMRSFLLFWLVASILFPIVSPGRVVRTMCMVFAGIIVIAWFVVGRWWPPRNHAAYVRRGRLLGAVLIGTWFALLLTAEENLIARTLVASISGAVLIAVGSVPGLFVRPDSG